MTRLENAKEYLIQELTEIIRTSDVDTFYEIVSTLEDMDDPLYFQNLTTAICPDYLCCEMCRKLYGDCSEEKDSLLEDTDEQNLLSGEDICRKRHREFYQE